MCAQRSLHIGDDETAWRCVACLLLRELVMVAFGMVAEYRGFGHIFGADTLAPSRPSPRRVLPPITDDGSGRVVCGNCLAFAQCDDAGYSCTTCQWRHPLSTVYSVPSCEACGDDVPMRHVDSMGPWEPDMYQCGGCRSLVRGVP